MKIISFTNVAIVGVILILIQSNPLVEAQRSPPSLTGVTGSSTTPTTRRPATRQPIRGKQECTKQPPNYRELDLPCGGYDRGSCQKLCQNLAYPRFYCRKEVFCLCHSGDLYSC